MSKSTVIHKYKWTLEEKLILIIPSLVLLGFTAKSSIEAGSFVFLWLLALVPWAACVALLINISLSKKKNSTLTAEFDTETTEVSVEGNKIYDKKFNKGKLSEAQEAYVKTVGVNETLVVSFIDKEAKSLFVPLRVAAKQPFLDFLIDHVLNADKVKKTDEVAAFFADAAKYKR